MPTPQILNDALIRSCFDTGVSHNAVTSVRDKPFLVPNSNYSIIDSFFSGFYASNTMQHLRLRTSIYLTVLYHIASWAANNSMR